MFDPEARLRFFSHAFFVAFIQIKKLKWKGQLVCLIYVKDGIQEMYIEIIINTLFGILYINEFESKMHKICTKVVLISKPALKHEFN